MDEQQRVFAEMKIFANEVRRDLIKIIAEAGSISFTLLKDDLSLTDGRLYFHLKKIDNYIEKDEQNFYRLNENGKRVHFQLFHETEALLTTQEKTESFEQDSFSKFVDKIAPSNLIYYFLGTKSRSIIELVIVLVTIAWLFGVTNNTFSSFERIFLRSAIFNMFVSIAHWFLYYGIILLILKLAKKEFDYIELLIGVLIGLIPYFLYLIPSGILYLTVASLPSWVSVLLTIFFVLCKIWSTFLLSQGLSLIAKTKTYQSLLIASTLILLDYIYLVVTLAS